MSRSTVLCLFCFLFVSQGNGKISKELYCIALLRKAWIWSSVILRLAWIRANIPNIKIGLKLCRSINSSSAIKRMVDADNKRPGGANTGSQLITSLCITSLNRQLLKAPHGGSSYCCDLIKLLGSSHCGNFSETSPLDLLPIKVIVQLRFLLRQLPVFSLIIIPCDMSSDALCIAS